MAESNQATKMPTLQLEQQQSPPPRPIRKIVAVAALATGINFGWALQLSLLTPYVQLLGIPHTWAAFIWLCGPISGMLVQPIVGFHSDRCTSRFGRRRPFILAGAVSIVVAVFLIGYAADIGHMSGDLLGSVAKPRAIAVFVVGFWIFDVANNMLQGPCRAFLGDLSDGSQKMMRSANAFFSFFMAIGNVLGYASGSYSHLYKMFPFTRTTACDVYCANLKSCFFIDVVILIILVTLALIYVKEPVWSPEKGVAATISGNETEVEASSQPARASSSPLGFFVEILAAFKTMKRPMRILLLVSGINMIAWFPFMLFDTDWVGREVYGGDSSSSANDHLKQLYGQGVRVGSLGLLLNSVVLMISSLGIEHTGRLMGGAKRLWGVVNLILAVFFGMIVLITKVAESNRRFTTGNGGVSYPLPPSSGVKGATLALFSIMGIPLAVTFSVPYALASIFSNDSGAGQGLSMGVLNLSVVIPQMIVSLTSGPWDALFGGGNLPAFVVGGVAAIVSGVLALTVLPSPPPDATSKTSSAANGYH